MKVKELIEELKKFDPEKQVVIEQEYDVPYYLVLEAKEVEIFDFSDPDKEIDAVAICFS